MIDEPTIVQTEPLRAALIHVVVPRDQIREAMGPALQELFDELARQGVEPAGPWFTHHRRMDPETFDFEIGVPVSAEVEPAGRVRPGEMRAIRAVRAVHRGPYDGLGASWGEVEQWIQAQGLTPAPDLREIYRRGPEGGAPPEEWRTELYKPLLE